MPELVATLEALVQSELVLALVLCGLTATLVTCCVPGTIVPLSISSGALLGGVEGALVVTAGAAIGSQCLFLVSRHLLRARIMARWGTRLQKFEDHFARRGLLYVAGLRVVGVPHFMVTAGCALSPLRAHTFLAATLVGLLPVIALTSTTGSLV